MKPIFEECFTGGLPHPSNTSTAITPTEDPTISKVLIIVAIVIVLVVVIVVILVTYFCCRKSSPAVNHQSNEKGSVSQDLEKLSHLDVMKFKSET